MLHQERIRRILATLQTRKKLIRLSYVRWKVVSRSRSRSFSAQVHRLRRGRDFSCLASSLFLPAPTSGRVPFSFLARRGTQ